MRPPDNPKRFMHGDRSSAPASAPVSAPPRSPEKLTGIHAVREALAAGQPLQTILIGKGLHGGRLDEIVRLARQNGVHVRFEERVQLDRAAGTREHQGVVALLAASAAISLENLLSRSDPGGKPGLLVLLDGVEDPQNLGAVIRTALAAGANGVIVPERRTAGLTEATARASAGAVAHLPVARVTNLARTMEELKEVGYWLVGLDERADRSHSDVDMVGPIALVLGGEGKGLHQLVRERCDFLAAIPTSGPVRSLNVSVAAGIALFEAVRQRAAKAAASSKVRPAHLDEAPDAER
jgi:23S rRNA (guanosine2251-2'-O)-methyltransferase